MSDLSDAITRLQVLVSQCTSVTFRSLETYPVDNVEPFPCSIAYISSGQFHFTNASIHHNFPVITLEFHFARVNLQQVHIDLDAIITEFPRRLAKDPTLNGTIQTVVATQDQPIPYEVRPFYWSSPSANPQIVSEMLKFSIPVKLLKAPLS